MPLPTTAPPAADALPVARSWSMRDLMLHLAEAERLAVAEFGRR